MNRASPVDLRKSIEAANALLKAGVRFVPMPVLDDADGAELIRQLGERLDKMAEQADGVAE